MALNLVKSWSEFLKNEARTITVEPILFLAAFGTSIVGGSQVTFYMRKIIHLMRKTDMTESR